MMDRRAEECQTSPSPMMERGARRAYGFPMFVHRGASRGRCRMKVEVSGWKSEGMARMTGNQVFRADALEVHGDGHTEA
jgi:hypothetical protein